MRHNVPPEVAHYRAQYAALKRDRATDDPELIEARRSLAVAGLAEHIRQVVETAPAPTPEQAAQLAALLRPPAEADETAAAS